MNVFCPNCNTLYRVDPAKVPENGVRARCAVCSAVFAVRRDGIGPAAAARDVATSTMPAELRAPIEAPQVEAKSPLEAPHEAPHVVAERAPAAALEIPEPTPAVQSMREPEPVSAPEPAAPASEPAVPPPPPPPPLPPPAPSLTQRPAFAGPAPAGAARPGGPAPARPAFPARGPGLPPPAVPGGLRPAARPAAPAVRPAAPETPAATASSSLSSPSAPGAVEPAPAAPLPSPDPAPAHRPINPFLSQDPGAKARRLARALISDMVVYHPAKRQEGLREGTLKDLFDEEIRKSWEEYADQVGKDVAESTSYFREALNEILADGRNIF